MRRPLLALLLCLLATPAWAEGWRLLIEGTGPIPTVTQSFDRLPQPPTPPLPPPPVVPPIVDTSPFPFPASQPGQEFKPEARYFGGLCPGNEAGCYAGLPEFSNPARINHLFACFLPPGMRSNGSALGGMRLYVPATLPPAQIRTLCAGGAL